MQMCKARGHKPYEIIEEDEVQGQRGVWRCTITACGCAATAEGVGKKGAVRAAAEKLLKAMNA